MSLIPPMFEQEKTPSAPDYLQYLSIVLIRMWGQLAQVVNYGIEMYRVKKDGTPLPGNVRGFVWRGDLTSKPTVIQHNLGYLPAGFIVMRITSNTIPYFESSTKTTITVDCNGSAPDTILLII